MPEVEQYLCTRCGKEIKNVFFVLLCDPCLKQVTEEAKRQKEKGNATEQRPGMAPEGR